MAKWVEHSVLNKIIQLMEVEIEDGYKSENITDGSYRAEANANPCCLSGSCSCRTPNFLTEKAVLADVK